MAGLIIVSRGSDIVDPVQKIWKVIAASSAGTMIEWYDFYIFGSLATILATEFYPAGNPTANFLKTLATFAVGFAVRPLGALVFGRIGDMIGRKFAFLMTLLIMGGSTAAIGFLPGYARIGIAAPIILVFLRLLQGLALGGEYGGAAVYVAEHAPDGKRGYYTSFIQTTATLGLFISLVVILVVRRMVGEEAFKAWGWRIPFLLSIVLVAMSFYIRARLKESPLFTRLQGASDSDSADSGELRDVVAMEDLSRRAFRRDGGAGGRLVHGPVLRALLSSDRSQGAARHGVRDRRGRLLLGAPLFVFFGSLSDRIGRKKIMMAGNLLAALSYYPIYQAMKAYSAPVNIPVLVGSAGFRPGGFRDDGVRPDRGVPRRAFPAKIRYTSLSLPYHFGNGWFGGFLPLIATAIVARTGNIYAGLAYPIVVALLTFVVGSLFLKESHTHRIWDEIDAIPPRAA